MLAAIVKRCSTFEALCAAAAALLCVCCFSAALAADDDERVADEARGYYGTFSNATSSLQARSSVTNAGLIKHVRPAQHGSTITYAHPQQRQRPLQLRSFNTYQPPEFRSSEEQLTSSWYSSPTSSTRFDAALGKSCTDDKDCLIKNARCLAGVCACAPSTVPLSNIACVPLSTSFGSSCVITAQCRALDPLAICYLDRCVCDSTRSVAGRNCQAINVDDSYILIGSMLSGISCVPKKHLGEDCCTDHQCSLEVKNSACRSGVCRCVDGYINIGQQQCAPKVSSVGGACSTNAQCSFDGAICDNGGHCACGLPLWCYAAQNTGVTAASQRRRRQIMKTITSQELADFLADISTGAAERGCVRTKFLGQYCVSNYQCGNRTLHSACVDNTCDCAENYVRVGPTQQCAPAVADLGVGTSCVVSQQCLTANAVCNSTTGTCSCNSHEYCEDSGVCQPKTSMDGACVSSCQCTTVNSICYEGSCVCSAGYTLNSNNDMCVVSTLNFASGTGRYYFSVGCCQNNTAPRAVGQVLIDPSSTVKTMPWFSLSSSPTYSIDANGVITAGAGSQPMFATTLTATAYASGYTSTVAVIITPDPCCSNVPTAIITSSITASLIPSTAWV